MLLPTTSDLTPREGKILRYVVSRDGDPVLPERCTNQNTWSDLPKTWLQARAALEGLRSVDLVERTEQGYTPTDIGRRLIVVANTRGIWRQ